MPGVKPPEPLEISSYDRAPGTVIVLVGELDVATAGHSVLARYFEQPVAAGREYVVADVAGLRFCDCAGLKALLRIHRRATASGGWLRLSGAAPRMRRLLRVTMLTDVLQCYPGIDEAFADIAVPDDRSVAHTGFDESGVG
ncbi:STAS domain-containing protein [Catenulispora pinisilvae]|uniref:STAS domain-containing protein n=1 Tax=Catenulispora pinisilvae TaxID=2705253 RepID=UPI0018913E2A|nr:STAS domain-containing protein [Catenulispora pinisilvae]